jgi:predicted metal-dependent phosphoesterase TrpH
MVKYGYAKTKEAAIKDYLNKLRVASQSVRPEEAISGILESGGIPVLAHPSFGDGDQLIIGEEMEKRLLRLIGLGIRGVEAFYSGFSPKLRNEMLSLADRYDLYVTAGSDYHGRNKLVELGDTGMDADESVPAGMKRFLEAITLQ